MKFTWIGHTREFHVFDHTHVIHVYDQFTWLSHVWAYTWISGVQPYTWNSCVWPIHVKFTCGIHVIFTWKQITWNSCVAFFPMYQIFSAVKGPWWQPLGYMKKLFVSYHSNLYLKKSPNFKILWIFQNSWVFFVNYGDFTWNFQIDVSERKKFLSCE